MKRYRDWNPSQASLMPVSPSDWLKRDHLVYFLLEVVCELDLREIEIAIHAKDARGTRPYNPRMMVALLLYGYCVGKVSSRKLERASFEEVPFRVLTGGAHPDHSAISDFRRRHLKALGGLFHQVLRLCQEAGLVKLGHVALDGTKMKANASRHKAGSFAGMTRSEERLAAEIEEMLKRAEATDAAEDERFGKDKSGDELPEGLRTKAERVRRLREAKAALEAEAARTKAQDKRQNAERKGARAASSGSKATAISAEEANKEARLWAGVALELAETRLELAREHSEEQESVADDARGRRAASLARQSEERVQRDLDETRAALAQEQREDGGEQGPKQNDVAPSDRLPSHRTAAQRDGSPEPKAQRSHTDPDSHLMKDGNGYEQAYNCQAVVDQEHQIIVAAALTNQAADAPHLVPMLDMAIENCGGVPETFTADAGYSSEKNLSHCESVGTDAYIPSRRKQSSPPDPTCDEPEPERSSTQLERMRIKISSDAGRRIYARRKWVAEGPFGQIKEARGLRGVLMRGIDKVREEWNLITTGHNLLKLYRAGLA